VQAQLDDAWVPPTPVTPPDLTAARDHFKKGVERFSNGDPAGALGEFTLAYANSPNPAVLYNIAVSLEKLGRDESALAVYERYLATGLMGGRATEVQQRVADLRHKLGL